MMTQKEKRTVTLWVTLFILSFIALGLLSNYIDEQSYKTCVEIKTIEKKETEPCEKIKEMRD